MGFEVQGVGLTAGGMVVRVATDTGYVRKIALPQKHDAKMSSDDSS